MIFYINFPVWSWLHWNPVFFHYSSLKLSFMHTPEYLHESTQQYTYAERKFSEWSQLLSTICKKRLLTIIYYITCRLCLCHLRLVGCRFPANEIGIVHIQKPHWVDSFRPALHYHPLYKYLHTATQYTSHQTQFSKSSFGYIENCLHGCIVFMLCLCVCMSVCMCLN